jgi:hypothetical protein
MDANRYCKEAIAIHVLVIAMYYVNPGGIIVAERTGTPFPKLFLRMTQAGTPFQNIFSWHRYDQRQCFFSKENRFRNS